MTVYGPPGSRPGTRNCPACERTSTEYPVASWRTETCASIVSPRLPSTVPWMPAVVTPCAMALDTRSGSIAAMMAARSARCATKRGQRIAAVLLHAK